MPSTSRKQQRFFRAELARKRAGKRTRTNMSESQIRDFAVQVESTEGDGNVRTRTKRMKRKG